MNREERLIEAALTLFAKRGFHGTSVAQIAAEARVAKGLFYHYFESKQALLVRLASVRLREWQPLIEQIESDRPAKERLEQLIDFVLDELTCQPERLRLLNSVYLTEEGERAIAEATRHEEFDRLATAQERLFTDLGADDPKLESIFFRSTLQGIALEYLLDPNGYPLETMRDELIRRFL